MTDSIVDGDEVDGQRLTELAELRRQDNPSEPRARLAARHRASRTTI